MDTEIHIRQMGLIDPKKLTHTIAIVGAGSIGGWTALCLGKLGCQDISVFDFDEVERHNAGSQVYKSADAEEKKVEALKFRLDFLLETSILPHDLKWTPDSAVALSGYDIVIAAVDNITTRQEIYYHCKGNPTLYIDARMAANELQIFTVRCDNEEDCKLYEQTLFPESEALEIPCSERSVVYNVFSVASLVGDLVAKYANELELPRSIEVDLYNFKMYTT